MKLMILLALVVAGCKTPGGNATAVRGIIDDDATTAGKDERLIQDSEFATYYWADTSHVFAVSCSDNAQYLSVTQRPAPTFITVEACKAKFAGSVRSLSLAAFKERALRVIAENEFVRERFAMRQDLNDFGAGYLADLEATIAAARTKVSAEEYKSLELRLAKERRRYAQVLAAAASTTPAPVSDPTAYVDLLVAALQRPDDITVADTHREPSVDVHLMVVDAVMNRLLPDQVREAHQTSHCWDSYSFVVVEPTLSCTAFGFQDGDPFMLSRMDASFFDPLTKTEIPDREDPAKIWGGGYLIEARDGLFATAVPAHGQRARPYAIDRNAVSNRIKPTGRFCQRRYQTYRGAAVQCGSGGV